MNRQRVSYSNISGPPLDLFAGERRGSSRGERVEGPTGRFATGSEKCVLARLGVTDWNRITVGRVQLDVVALAGGLVTAYDDNAGVGASAVE